jgi:hypothetical protein
MTMVQFGNFCRSTSLVNETLSLSDVDRTFLRAVRAVPSGAAVAVADTNADGWGAGSLLSALSGTGLKASKEWRKAGQVVSAVGKLSKPAANLMNQAQVCGKAESRPVMPHHPHHTADPSHGTLRTSTQSTPPRVLACSL